MTPGGRAAFAVGEQGWGTEGPERAVGAAAGPGGTLEASRPRAGHREKSPRRGSWPEGSWAPRAGGEGTHTNREAVNDTEPP